MNLFHYHELKTVLKICKLGEKAQGRKILRLFCIYPRRRYNIFRNSFYLWSKKYCSGKTEISWHADQICISLLIVVIYKTTWTNVDFVRFRRKELWIFISCIIPLCTYIQMKFLIKNKNSSKNISIISTIYHELSATEGLLKNTLPQLIAAIIKAYLYIC